jgi:hypothetical protein
LPNAEFDLFISYRRSDSAGHARALYRDLCRRFDKQRIFFDRESIEAGSVFPDRLREGIDACRVLLALIAPGWLDAKNAAGQRRLDSEDDFVRQEIAGALRLGRHVIPVLFDDTPMPDAGQLPEVLRPLAACDALLLRGKNFEYDVQLEELIRLLAAVPRMPVPLPAGAGVVVGAGLDFDVYRRTPYVPIRLRAPLRAAFQPLIDDRTRFFAGRRQVVERIMEFTLRDEGGYLVITAPPGFGKTALMANLVAATPEAFAYHFFAPVYGEETLDEKFFLQNVLQQMAAWHGHNAELPEAINELRALYQTFVDTPLEHDQVLVLDGLDEVAHWQLAPYLGRRLPAHLHLVVTLRDVGQDWRRDYAFPADQVVSLALGGLDRDDIRQLFAGLGAAGARIAGNPVLLEQIVDRAAYADAPGLGADPFYVRFLAEDVAAAEVTPEQIADQPRGLDAYLDRWWKQIVQLAGDAPLRDLFGTLAAALGPIARGDLEAITASLRDDWAGDFFEQVLSRVRRLVRRDGAGRYGLAHPRLRQYVADPRRIGKINDYRGRVLEYCRRWPEHRSPYALTCLGTHLADAGHLDELARLFSSEWLAAQWSILHTWAALIADLERAAKALLALPAPDYPRILGLVVARQTARELMLGFPDEVFVAWTAQGESERARACLGALGKTGARAINPLLAVAGKLLEVHREGADDHAEQAAELLQQVIDQLPLVRRTNEQHQIVSALAALLPRERGLPELRRLQLLRQAVEFAERADDPVLRAAALGSLASALAASSPDREQARQLLDRARTALAGIDFPADRAFVFASQLPALQILAPATVLPELTALVNQGKALLQHGSLAKSPLIRLLERWRPGDCEQRQEAIALLCRLAGLYLDTTVADYAGVALSAIVPDLCRLGRVDLATDLVERCWAADALEGARIVAYAIDTLQELLPEKVSVWLVAAAPLTDSAHHDMPINRELFTAAVANARAATGDWHGALELAATLRGSERADALVGLLRRLGAARQVEATQRESLVDEILALAGDADEAARNDGMARVVAVAAQVLDGAAGSRGEALLAQATALCLARLPEGDLDELRRLLAVALHADGASAEALRVVSGMTWVDGVAATLAFLAQAMAADPGRRDAYVEVLIKQLAERAGAALYGDALRAAAPLVVGLARQQAPLAGVLAEAISQRLGALRLDDQIEVVATLAAGLCLVDADRGASQYGRLLDWIDSLRARGYAIAAAAIARFIVQLASVAEPLGDRLAPLVDRIRAVAADFTDDADAISVRGALCLFDVRQGCAAVRDGLQALLPTVAALAAAGPRALYLTRMFADLVGRRSGRHEAQARAAAALAEAVVRCAHPCPAEASRVIADCLEQALTIQTEDDRAQALIDIFGKLPAGPAGWSRRIEGPVASILARTQIADGERFVDVCAAAVAAMCACDDVDAAERLARQAGDPDLRDRLLSDIERERERLTLGELSDFERAFVAIGNGQLAHAVLHSVKVENDSANILGYLVEALVVEEWGTERERLLAEFLPQVAAPLRALHGTAAIARLLAELEAVDGAFLAAASIVGKGGGQRIG